MFGAAFFGRMLAEFKAHKVNRGRRVFKARWALKETKEIKVNKVLKENRVFRERLDLKV
jgi:hypothetical protein